MQINDGDVIVTRLFALRMHPISARVLHTPLKGQELARSPVHNVMSIFPWAGLYLDEIEGCHAATAVSASGLLWCMRLG